LAEILDRVVASDPGLARLRVAGSAAIGVASALGVEYVFATLTTAGAQGTLVAMLLGAVVAMMGSMALTNTSALANAKLAVFFPVAVGIGMAIGIAIGNRNDLMLAVFVLVMFVSVFIRRFGPPFFVYGFMGWMGYFFASFLHATLPMLPALLYAVVLASAWVLLLSVTVLRTNPHRTLRRIVRATDARARAVARAAADMLTGSGSKGRALRRLHGRQTRLAEVALMVEAWSANPGALADGWSAAALRRKLIDAQQAIDGIAAAAEALAEHEVADLRALGVSLLDRLARRDDLGANRAAYALAEVAEDVPHDARDEGWWPARHLAVAALEFIALARRADQLPDDIAGADEFEPAVTLAMGNLPGAPAVASGVRARGHRWNPLARMDLPARQAVQVAIAGALAILAGRELSETRYYWAVIAAFVMFAGTGTRAEAFLKGFNRVLGTLVGLFASIGLAGLTAGHTNWVLVVIVASVFGGFYLIQVSYAYMIFFITIMVGQLYSVLHEFSNGFLVLRLEETTIGAAVGFLVALVVVPLSTRDTVRNARDELLVALADLLDRLADRLSGGAPSTVVTDQSVRALDDHVRRLVLAAKPLTRPLVWGNSPPRTRHRLALYTATATQTRRLASAVRRTERTTIAGPAAASGALAQAARQIAEAPVGHQQPTAVEPLARADTVLFARCSVVPGGRANDPIIQPLIRLRHLLREIAEPGTPARVDAIQPEPIATPAAVLTGTVTDESGAPLRDGVVLLFDAAHHQVAREHVGADGSYRVEVPSASYILTVTAPGRQPVARRVNLPCGLTLDDRVLRPLPTTLSSRI
jgi:uncharacterized membrane protein YccC